MVGHVLNIHAPISDVSRNSADHNSDSYRRGSFPRHALKVCDEQGLLRIVITSDAVVCVECWHHPSKLAINIKMFAIPTNIREIRLEGLDSTSQQFF